MKYKPVVSENHPAYGYIFEVDFTEELDKFGITHKTPFEVAENVNSESGKLLYTPETRSTIHIHYLPGTVFEKFHREVLTYDLINEIIYFSSTTADKFRALYPCPQELGSIERLCRNYFDIQSSICFDQQTFKLHRHVDNRLVLGNIIINLTDDNKDSTKFYLSGYHDNSYYSAPKGFGKGVLFFNTEATTHSIHITQTKKRVIFMTGLNIRKPWE